jgi:RNA polymerase sigma-70 factor (ECF subfamily)
VQTSTVTRRPRNELMEPTAAIGADSASEPAGATEFVRRHQAGVWRFLRALGCPAHVADDLTQDALLVALRRNVQRTHEAAAAAAFLRQTARHLWLRTLRDERRRAAKLAEAAESLWRQDCAEDDGAGVLAALAQCVASLPERSRLVLERCYRDEAGRAELARELELSEHGVRSLLQRLRKALRDCIDRRLHP